MSDYDTLDTEDREWALAEKRMNVIGQNGNDGLHYSEVGHQADLSRCVPVCDLPVGQKFDSGKPEFSLIPPLALEEVAKVLTFGAAKYGRENWRDVPEAKRRYLDAALRHLNSYRATAGAPDPESKHSYLAHCIASLLFILELELESLDRDVE